MRKRSSVHAACLFLENRLIEYETVKDRFPRCRARSIGSTRNRTLGKSFCMYEYTQLPSKMTAAFSLPSASPHQPTPS